MLSVSQVFFFILHHHCQLLSANHLEDRVAANAGIASKYQSIALCANSCPPGVSSVAESKSQSVLLRCCSCPSKPYPASNTRQRCPDQAYAAQEAVCFVYQRSSRKYAPGWQEWGTSESPQFRVHDCKDIQRPVAGSGRQFHIESG